MGKFAEFTGASWDKFVEKHGVTSPVDTLTKLNEGYILMKIESVLN